MDSTGADIHVSGEEPENLAAEEVQRALDYLLSHKMAFVQDFLRNRGLPFSGTKEKLRERLEGYLAEGSLAASDLVQLLDQIEGWGDQHVYLYKAYDQAIEPWLREDSTRDRVRTVGLEKQFGRLLPLVLPEEMSLSSIDWTPERVRFVWVEKRQWEERVPEEDIVKDDMVWRAYRIKVSRGLIAFDWDLVSGYAMLMIRRLPRGTRYDHIRSQFEKLLEPIVGISRFERVRVSQAIGAVELSGEVRRRQIAYQTRRGGKASFTSASRSGDTSADPALQGAVDSLRGETAGVLGNFYWLPGRDGLASELHCKLYAADHRVGVFGEHEERDVRYVISRIRYYCG